ncbi:hypothetical protein Pan44_14580 [Caulifigura coniformis]|uniref:HEAT repeat protein n=1 Tax=Caulifigura coniformis TaxID=2527983 RepID=A0A517SBC6_9PLAN|nr:hypothetical protein [Caulifigura coniformis]QDT53441.1 hypothetical protein Pan44_14580 [Caulifigura coniformis]
MHESVLGLALAIVGLSAGGLPAAETVPSTSEFSAQWLRDLGSDDFRIREQAADEIARAGAAAIEPLKREAPRMDRESAVRCLSRLEHFSRASDPETAQAANAALLELETSSNPAVAELAAAALVKTERLPPTATLRLPLGPLPRMNVQLSVRVEGRSRTTTQTINGQRTITIEEDGDKTVIEDQAGRNIRVTIRKVVNGAEQTTEHSAVDLEDLRRKAPEVARLYEAATQPKQAQGVEQLRADLKAKREKANTAARAYLELNVERNRMRREGKTGTPEYEALEKRVEAAREALRSVHRP